MGMDGMTASRKEKAQKKPHPWNRFMDKPPKQDYRDAQSPHTAVPNYEFRAIRR